MLVFTSVILSCTEHFSHESAPDVLINDLGATRVHIMHVAQGTSLAAFYLEDLISGYGPFIRKTLCALAFTAI